MITRVGAIMVAALTCVLIFIVILAEVPMTMVLDVMG